MLYFGASLVLHTVWPFVLTPLLLVIMNAGVIAREEAYLEQKFGEQYLSYKRKVRRWI